MDNKKRDEKEIDEIVRQFFDLFTNTDNRKVNVRNIGAIFLANGMLINNTNSESVVYDLDSFIEPREAILTDGTLTNFTEFEVSHQTNIFGNIAQRVCHYKKSGVLHGKPFVGEGTKLMQLLKQENKWYLSSVIWSDK